MGSLNDHFPGVNARVAIAKRTLRQYWANGSARAWVRLLKHRFRVVYPVRPPFYVDIAPTYRCQCRCVHCAAVAQEDAGDQLTTAEIKAVLDEAAQMGVLQVIFSGGEPLLHKDILELIRHAHNLGLLARVNTNGLLLTRERVRELKQAGLTLVGLSLDHADPAEHDRLRGLPGLYEKAMEGVRNLHEAGILCQLQVYVSKETAGQGVRDIIAKGREMGVYRVFAFFAIATGRWEAAFDELLTEEQEADLRTLQGTGLYHVELATARTPCCALEGDLVYVGGTGNVTICPFVPYTFGNVRNGGLAAIWRRRMARADAPYRGRCPMNLPEGREMLKQRAAEIAGRND